MIFIFKKWLFIGFQWRLLLRNYMKELMVHHSKFRKDLFFEQPHRDWDRLITQAKAPPEELSLFQGVWNLKLELNMRISAGLRESIAACRGFIEQQYNFLFIVSFDESFLFLESCQRLTIFIIMTLMSLSLDLQSMCCCPAHVVLMVSTNGVNR